MSFHSILHFCARTKKRLLIYKNPTHFWQGLEYLAAMRSLRSVTFTDCNAFTNAGIEKLSKLVNLEQLSFIRCTRVSEKGMSFIHRLPKLSSLTIFTCPKVRQALTTEI